MLRPLILAAALAAPVVFAGPMIPAGDLALRHDIQRLADRGVITGTTMGADTPGYQPCRCNGVDA